MADPKQQLVAELVAERFAPVSRRPDRTTAAAKDSAAVVAERQHALNAALEGRHLVALDATTEAAA